MSSHPWISLNSVSDLLVHKITFSEILRGKQDARPMFLTFFGGKKKSTLLASMSGYTRPMPPHGQVNLVLPRKQSTLGPEIYIDCELGVLDPPPALEQNRCQTRHIPWLDTDAISTTEFPNLFAASVLAPISNVLCYFAADLHGISGISSILAYQATRKKTHTLPKYSLPHVLVVVDTRSTHFDASTVEKKLYNQIIEKMSTLKDYSGTDTQEIDLQSRFQTVQILGLPKERTSQAHAEDLKQRLYSLNSEIHGRRTSSRYLFSTTHADALVQRMLDRFCSDNSQFNFVRDSRPNHFSSKDSSCHISEILSAMPSPSWIWGVVIPLLASAIFLSNYPPSSHAFLPTAVYEEFYKVYCKDAIRKYTADRSIHQKFESELLKELNAIFHMFEANRDDYSAARQHLERLNSLGPHLADMKSLKSCFSCLALEPEKVFECGHAICNVCVRRFGQHSQYERHIFTIPACILCGRVQPRLKSTFRLIPPTAGIRILSIDGGGIRGVIPLTFLQSLNSELHTFNSDINDHFDYVCGTSAGGLIAIGVFLMHWSPDECLTRFEAVAKDTFKVEQDKILSLTQRAQRLFKACLKDHRYNLSPIEKAFGSEFSSKTKMFNPLQKDTKVAVTATTVRANKTCMLSNYNGEKKAESSNYHHVRATTYEHEISISDAAACTSAAPFFFKSKDVNHLDTFQDGGLRHNNPIFLASWECARLWPSRGQVFETDGNHVDHIVSLGTGAVASATFSVGTHTPKKDRFWERLKGSFLEHLDGEAQWNSFLSCTPVEFRPRYQRLNIYYPGSEPALNDVAAIDRLKSQARDCLASNSNLVMAKDLMLASMFYFELESISQLEGGGYRCFGIISCRITLSIVGRKKLWERLREKNAVFMHKNRAIPCVTTIPEGIPPFRCGIVLVLKSVTDSVNISIRNFTTRTTVISGMPTTLNELIEAQGLHAAFGSIEKVRIERELPEVPLKRKRHDI